MELVTMTTSSHALLVELGTPPLVQLQGGRLAHGRPTFVRPELVENVGIVKEVTVALKASLVRDEHAGGAPMHGMRKPSTAVSSLIR
jgi:hypothetical protein